MNRHTETALDRARAAAALHTRTQFASILFFPFTNAAILFWHRVKSPKK